MSKVGSTSFEVSSDLFDAAGDPVACVRTLRVRTGRDGRPQKLSFDGDFMRARFAGVASKVEAHLRARGGWWSDGAGGARAPVAPPHAFEARVRVRHSDQDQNDHVNSAAYLALLHDARDAALAAGAYPAPAAQRAASDAWIAAYGASYDAEATVRDDLRIRTWFDGERFWFQFGVAGGAEFRPTTTVWVRPAGDDASVARFAPLVTLRPDLYAVPCGGAAYEGCDPRDWGCALPAVGGGLGYPELGRVVASPVLVVDVPRERWGVPGRRAPTVSGAASTAADACKGGARL